MRLSESKIDQQVLDNNQLNQDTSNALFYLVLLNDLTPLIYRIPGPSAV